MCTRVKAISIVPTALPLCKRGGFDCRSVYSHHLQVVHAFYMSVRITCRYVCKGTHVPKSAIHLLAIHHIVLTHADDDTKSCTHGFLLSFLPRTVRHLVSSKGFHGAWGVASHWDNNGAGCRGGFVLAGQHHRLPLHLQCVAVRNYQEITWSETCECSLW